MELERVTRRGMLGAVAASGAVLLSAPASARAQSTSTFLSIIRDPDAVTVFEGLDQPLGLRRSASGWNARGARVRIEARDELHIGFAAPGVAPTHVHVRWNVRVAPHLLLLGDAWERSYGDLQWTSSMPQRVMPWYFLTSDAGTLHGYGVKTGAAALCFWQADPDGVSLWLDVRNGGSAVKLGDREVALATVVARRGSPHETPMSSAKAFCAQLCERPRALPRALYGSNDWYYAYGKNSAQGILRDAELMASLAPSGAERPFTVIDDGWENGAYGSMSALASNIRRRGVRPGLWIRPLQAASDAATHLLLPALRFGSSAGEALPAYDPTNADALERILVKVRRAVAWGFDLIKHDYTTYELFGQWGFEMNAQPALPGWSFADRTRTNAEIVRDLYRHIRNAAGEHAVIIGCNTIGHLGAGFFEAQRTGDDVSGKDWERTRRMGVNTLAHRYPQNRTFFVMDADCAPITTWTPWEMNRQWLDVLSRSGTALFVSPQPEAVGRTQRQAIREAFVRATQAAASVTSMEVDTTTPQHWEFAGAGGRAQKTYSWYGVNGAWPFDV